MRLLLRLLALTLAFAWSTLRPVEAAGLPWSTRADFVFSVAVDDELKFTQAIVQDQEGFVWAGTSRGLVRWDGYEARPYSQDSSGNSLPDHYVSSLRVSRNGDLWIGTNASGLFRLDRRQDQLIRMPDLGSPTVWCIEEDQTGRLWLGTAGGLRRLDPGAASVNVRSLLVGVGVRSVARAADDRLWIGTERGLFRLDPDSDVPQPVALPVEGPPPTVSALHVGTDGRLWIGTLQHGAFLLSTPSTTVNDPPLRLREQDFPEQLPGEGVLAIAEDSAGAVWLGTRDGGVVIVSTTPEIRLRRLRRQPRIAESLPDDNVSALLHDRAGLMWTGGNRGLGVTDLRPKPVATVFGAPDGTRQLTQTSVHAVVASPDGRLWAAVGDGGIDILDAARGRVGELRPGHGDPRTALPKSRIKTLVIGHGGVWIGSNKGLYRADLAGTRAARVDIPGRASDLPIWSLCPDAEQLWVGGQDGLRLLRPEADGRLQVLLHLDGERFANQRVNALARGDGADLWIGTRTGLFRLDIERLELRAYSASDGFRPGFVVSILRDRRGRIWVASEGGGLQVVENPRHGSERPHIRHIGSPDDRAWDSADMVLEDGSGRIWVSKNDGLAVINPDTFAVRPLREGQGVSIRTYWGGAGTRAADGDLVFGGLGGVSIGHPEALDRAVSDAPMAITDLRVGERRRPGTTWNDTAPGTHHEPLTLDPDERTLFVEFASLEFVSTRYRRYRYRLRGFDDAWTTGNGSAAGQRLAAYTNLPPGDYELQLAASTDEPGWSAKPLTVPVRVLPSWHQTTMFKAAVALGGMATLFALLQARTAWLRRSKRRLEAVVDERTEALRLSQAELERLAHCDALTGIANRRRFNDEIGRLLASFARSGRGFALLLFDLDRFKQLNDTWGHDAGDAMLVATAKRLRAALRETDIVARLGGDEFACLLADDGEAPRDVAAVCDRLLKALKEPVEHGALRVRCDASIGVSVCPVDSTDADSLYKCADEALYEAKRAGRDTWRFHRA